MGASNEFSRELAKKLLPLLFQHDPSIDGESSIAEVNDYE